MNSDENQCARWLEQSRQPEVQDAIGKLHTEIAERSQKRNPVCTASGRCCKFERYGHRLYVTGLEVALTLDSLPRARVLNSESVTEALDGGTCPFVQNGLCGIHPVRPAGCRVYFCDSSARLFVNQLAEFGADEIKLIHDRFEIEYRYAEWRALLQMFIDAKVATVSSRPAVFAASDPFVPLTVDPA